jgi:succinyl-CoA synthetase alpha subunit
LPPECGVLVQGITGRAASSHTRLMREYGTDIRAGVTPGKGGGQVHGVPVYDTVAQAREAHDIHASVIFVPARFARDAVMEAAAAGIPLVVCITEGIPQADMLKVLERLPVTDTTLVGPNTPGIVVPGRTRLGIAPGAPFTPGPVAVLSRSGTLTYEAAARLSAAGLGQSLALGIGGDPFVGAGFADCLLALEHDPETRAVLLLGEIGGRAEEAVAHLVSTGGFTKPVVCFIAGLTAPPGKTLGHAGAILEGPGGVASKLSALAHAGIPVAGTLADIPGLVRAAV